MLLVKEFVGWGKGEGWGCDKESFVLLEKKMERLSMEVVGNGLEGIREMGGMKRSEGRG